MANFNITGFERYKPFITTTASSDPAANGSEISATVPAGQIWFLQGARVSLVTDANAANRTVAMTIDDGTTVIQRFTSPSTQAASLTYGYTFTAGAANATVLNLEVVVGIGTNLLLPPGYRIKTVTNNVQATDNYGAMTFYIVKYTL